MYNFHAFGASEKGYRRNFLQFKKKRQQIFWKVVKDII